MESAPQMLSAVPSRVAGATLACLAAVTLQPQTARAQPPIATTPPASAAEADRQRMEQQLQELLRMRQEFDKRIGALEAELHGTSPVPAATAPAPEVQTISGQQAAAPPPAKFGEYQYGKGFTLARTDLGELSIAGVSYVRYLNQTNTDKNYTDSFGNHLTTDPRQDVQLAKVQITVKGWLFTPNFGYNMYVWTSNSNQGQSAQVVAAGNLSYKFNDALTVYGGVQSLPSTRSTNRTFPSWLRNDNRPIADEFFRGSYTQGFWAEGRIMRGLDYRVEIANNLSALGVNAGQLDPKFNTVSGALTWTPTTGEFGPQFGFGDFEDHQKVATLFDIHYTSSTETPQSQPGTESIENTQLRLSDGTLLFKINAFNTPGNITEARYQMAAAGAGVKYRGYSLEFEYYQRVLNEFKTVGVVPVTSVLNNGYQLQASAMLMPKQLQAYLSGSQIFGKYGNPYDVAVGLNWFPFKRKEFRVNPMALYVYKSPVGYSAYPLQVGSNGFVFLTDFSLVF